MYRNFRSGLISLSLDTFGLFFLFYFGWERIEENLFFLVKC